MEKTASVEQLVILSKSSSSVKDSVELPKLKLPKKPQKMSKLLQDIMKPKTRAKKKYFTAASGVNAENAIDLDKQPSPYEYPPDLEQFAHKVMAKAWRKDLRIREMKVKCHQKPSFVDRQKKGILNRLYVEEPKVESMKTVLDVDQEYFSVINGMYRFE